MKYPDVVKINDKYFKINTDFRVAIECNRIALDKTINDYERALAIIYKIFGDQGLDAFDKHDELLKKAQKFLACGKEIEKSNKDPDMDFVQDMDYIEASFMSDYSIDLTNTKMHWWKFINLMNGLSNSEFGNCCVLNRVRRLRTYDTKDIKDPKQLAEINEAKRSVQLKKNNPKNELSEKQMQSIDNFYKQLGIERKE